MAESKFTRSRRRHSKAERESVLLEYASSELSQVRFAEIKGISISTFQNWLRKSRESEADAKPGDLVPVRLVPGNGPKKPASSGLIEIELASGSVIRVAPGFDPDEIRELVKILRESC